jgi:hypothetical protein
VTAPPAHLQQERTGAPSASPITTPPPVGETPVAAAGSSPSVARTRSGPIDPASAMNARALAFYRRAEGAQRTGDKAAALLQIKMAIAADPKSTFLRAALAELTKS